ncbi:hypothetical protein EG328_012013 [Venturia inaequalis]|uniref:Uncharacterized protein n=1 Tax=Venturia inaequalis TaxID=5025 RepID=A0A8H3U418_VENIN|nr:hypothetical protein EG328_012013 [Venturia inaequalis]
MDSITNKVTSAVGNKEEQAGQPGNSIERSADNATNSSTHFPVPNPPSSIPPFPNRYWYLTDRVCVEVDDVAGQAGVPQQADGAINKAVDGKINSEIPGGN